MNPLSAKKIEEALVCLVDYFIKSPFAFFTEADAVAHFRQLLILKTPALQKHHERQDKIEVSLVHSEYNRFSDEKGHYDMVIMDPRFVNKYSFEEITNVNKKGRVKLNSIEYPPLEAAFEFKWSKKGRPQTLTSAEKDLINLNKDTAAQLRYFILFIRECSQNIWGKKGQELLKKAEETKNNVRSILVNYNAKESEIYQFGSWKVKYNNKNSLKIICK
ncbi:MAG: hypothetical protein M1147_04090 [Nitrospirae bacterium]|nr:hypothetical protein [Nitrospirota bacterium]MCL5977296.1 hypothetical protein [Nitrospirota bacterium]